MNRKTTCIECGELLENEYSSNNQDSKPCPKCGSIGKDIKIVFSDRIDFHDNIRGKIKDANYPNKKNPRVAFFQGDELRKSDGKWMKKERLIDKNANIYKEVVTDPETGKIVHHCEEPLKNHKGHGYDKKEDTEN